MDKQLTFDEIPAGEKFVYADEPRSMIFMKPHFQVLNDEDFQPPPIAICLDDGAECRFRKSDLFELVTNRREEKPIPFCNLKGGDKFRWDNRTCIKLSADSKLGNAICVESYLQGNTYCISSFDSVEKL